MPAENDDFQTKVLDGVKNLQTNQQKLLSDVDRLDKETKKSLEDFTKATKRLDDLEDVTQKLGKLRISLNREAKAAFGSFGQRIGADPEMRANFNALIRLAVQKEGDMRDVVAKILGKSLSTETSPGNTLFTSAMGDEIFHTLAQYGAWASLGVKRLGTKVTKWPVKTARPVAGFFRKNVGRALAEDTAKAGVSVDVFVEIIGLLLNVELELLQDAEFDVTADLMDDFFEAYARALDVGAFISNGTDDYTNGGYTGLFNFAPTVVAAATHTAVGTTTYDDWLKPLLAVDSAILGRQPKWWMHPQQLVRALGVKDGNGRPIFLTALEAPSYGALGTIMGRPVVPVEIAPNEDGAGKKLATFGDPAGYVVGLRNDYVFESSDHAGWTAVERSFRGYGRAGFKGRRTQAFSTLVTAAA